MSADPAGLDHLVGAGTEVHDLPGAAVPPAFDDTHTHLIFAALGAHDVPVHRVEAVVRRGWRVGTHAYGDRAVRTLPPAAGSTWAPRSAPDPTSPSAGSAPCAPSGA